MAGSSKPQKDYKSAAASNMRLVALLLAAATLVVTVRLFDVQIVHADKYKKSATYAQWNEETLSAMRGTIYDANGSVIARSAQTWQLYVIPENFSDDSFRSAVCTDLAQQLGLDYDELMEVTRTEQQTDENELVIAHKKTVKTQMELSEKKLIDCGEDEKRGTDAKCLMHKTFVKGGKTFKYSDVIGLDTDSKRYYPMGSFASSLVGTVNSDGEGVTGIERYYNSLLSGSDGKVTSYGTNLDEGNENYYSAVNGTNLELTIDETVQYCLDEQLQAVYKTSGGIGAYGIVMDVNTGAILAMDAVGYKGGYDLNDPDTVNSYYEAEADRAAQNDNFDYLEKYLKDVEDGEEELEEIRNMSSFEERSAAHRRRLRYFFRLEQWNNYLVSETYHPGSVFKIFLTAAAIEEHILEDDYTYCCGGSITVDDRTFNCHYSPGHGYQDLRKGLMNSCNPFFVKLGLTLGSETFFKYFKAFGFTEKTGIESIEEANSIYYKEDELTRVTLASESFGQTFSITPIQVITGISAIANGGYLMEPYLVAKQLDDDGNIIKRTTPTVKRQVISGETAAEVASMMEDVVKSGTGKNGYVAGYRVAGKTGTTQKYQLKGTYIASFGCFAPADDPEIAVLIIVDEPQGEINGSTVCAPVAAKVVEATLEYLGVERQYTENEMSQLDTTTPGVIGKDPDTAEDILEEAGFTVRVIGDGGTVVSQSPAGGQTIPQGGVVAIYTTDDDEEKLTVTVPDLSGLGVSGVKKYAASEGVNVRISGNSGSGVVSYDQSVEAGAETEYGTIITVYFKSYENIGDAT